MPIEVRDLRGLDGPNLYYSQAGVKLQVWSDRDIRREISDSIKRWAQVTGLVIGYLEQTVKDTDGGQLITTTWTTPFPSVGERVAEAVVADLQAAEQGNEEYSHDDLLFEIIRMRKREEPPLAVLQMYAEARVRDLPFVPRGDGKIMIGSGRRGFIFDPAGLSLGLSLEIPWDSIGRIPVVAITGTNGKTTTTRLIAHVLEVAGTCVGRTDTDGITIDGVVVETGDWAGFEGARRVLTDPRVEVAVLETSRGGILRRGLGFDVCDVSVITNISSDHLGELGIETVEELAHVKGVVALATDPNGRAVLNADDDQVARLAPYIRAPSMWFTRHPEQERLKTHSETGGDAVWTDGIDIHVARAGKREQFPLTDIPIVVGGAAGHNVENVLAATAACAALGIDVPLIARSLRTFGQRAEDNRGRLNLFEADGVTAILDYAHNEAGLRSLVELGAKLVVGQGSRLILLLGGPGDRADTQIIGQGVIAGERVDWLLVHEEEPYLRGREPGTVPALYRKGALRAGMPADRILMFSDETSALSHALGLAQPGDIVLAAAHARRSEMLAALQDWSSRRK